ncbi:eukaryotic translation initiation factor 3 subunit H-like [Ornithodoros turicata]|uniref:Eukaryotic translation initiation factor 3 subunit H n=1 Tax=Ornithodoros turicata TaxID=34597 RepID=A0A2R5LMB1_9ACAR
MASSRDRRHTETESPVDYVQVDGLVVLKIIKHCSEEPGVLMDVAQGVLLGLINNNCVEITNCFPIPRHADEEESDDLEYQMEMMRQMRHVNVDHLHVGWYQSSHFGSFYNRPLLESQFGYQTNITESVVLIYDPVRTTRGFLSLRAFRLTDSSMKLMADGEFGPENFKSSRCSFETIFEEIPVVIRNSHLANIMLCELEEYVPPDVGRQFFDMSTAFFLEKNLQAMMECTDSVNQETNKFINYQRQVMRQQQQKQQYLQKRNQENQARVDKGEPPLPDEDINKLFKPIPAPPRLDTVLYCGQISSYCQQVSQFSTQNLAKLFMAESLQLEHEPNSLLA